MKLYNVVIGYDVWVLAETREAAFSAAKSVIPSEQPSDILAYELAKAKDIPARVQGLIPYVTANVVDKANKLDIDLDNDDVHLVFKKLNVES